MDAQPAPSRTISLPVLTGELPRRQRIWSTAWQVEEMFYRLPLREDLLTGSYFRNVEIKNRLMLPASLRTVFEGGAAMIMAIPKSSSLWIVPRVFYRPLLDKMADLGLPGSFTRYLTNTASEIAMDGQNRVIIGDEYRSKLCKRAGSYGVAIRGCGNFLEITGAAAPAVQQAALWKDFVCFDHRIFSLGLRATPLTGERTIVVDDKGTLLISQYASAFGSKPAHLMASPTGNGCWIVPDDVLRKAASAAIAMESPVTTVKTIMNVSYPITPTAHHRIRLHASLTREMFRGKKERTLTMRGCGNFIELDCGTSNIELACAFSEE